jgi:hypothetical protein
MRIGLLNLIARLGVYTVSDELDDRVQDQADQRKAGGTEMHSTLYPRHVRHPGRERAVHSVEEDAPKQPENDFTAGFEQFHSLVLA